MVKTPVTLSSWPARSLFSLALAGLGWAMGYGMGRNSNVPPDDAMGKKALPSAGVPGTSNGLSLLSQRQHLLREPGGLSRRLALLRLADQTSTGGRLSLLNDGSLSMDEATRLVQAWAEEDPAACWAWQREGGMAGVDYTNTIFEAWAKKAPEAAVAAARSASLDRRWSAVEALFSVWMRNEDPAAGALGLQLNQLAALTGGNMGAGWGIADENGKMSSRILSLPPGPARAGLLRGYASGLFDKDWEQGAAWAAKLPDSDRAAVMEELAGAALMNGRIAYYSGADRKEPGPERQAWARQWLEEEADPATRARLGSRYVTSLASTDPAGAMAWAEENMSGLPLSQAVAEVVGAQARKDRTAAASLIDGLPPGGVRMKATQSLMENWLTADASAAMDWLSAQGKEAMDSRGWSRITGMWSYNDQKGFQKYIASHPEAFQPGMLSSATYNMVRKDAAGTMAWASTLPTTLRTEMMGQTFGRWTQNDPPAAAQYVTENPSAPLSANAIDNVTGRYFSRDGGAAVDWAANLPPGATRDAAITKLLETIPSEKDSARREAWLGRLGAE